MPWLMDPSSSLIAQEINPSRRRSHLTRFRSARLCFIFSTRTRLLSPCFQLAFRARAFPSIVFGPVLLPPCNLQRVRLPMAGFWHASPARVFAPHLRPGQPGPKRVAMPASISSAWLTLFTIRLHRSRGRTSINLCQALSEGPNPVPRSAHHGPRPIAPRPRDTPHRRLSGHAFHAL